MDNFTDEQLVRAVELMVSPDDLTIREVAEAVLRTLGYTPAEIAAQLASGEHLNAGECFQFRQKIVA